MNGVEAYPLHWPQNKARTRAQEQSRFGKSPGVCRDELFHELRLLGARSITLSTNVALRHDGLPYASRRPPEDTGVAVYFEYNRKSMCFACDQWIEIHENIYAIAKTIGAIRGISRWGSSDMLNQAFAGFEALPHTNGSGARPWWEVFKVCQAEPTATIVHLFQLMRSRLHPDKSSGSHEAFIELQDAYEQFKSERNL